MCCSWLHFFREVGLPLLFNCDTCFVSSPPYFPLCNFWYFPFLLFLLSAFRLNLSQYSREFSSSNLPNVHCPGNVYIPLIVTFKMGNEISSIERCTLWFSAARSAHGAQLDREGRWRYQTGSNYKSMPRFRALMRFWLRRVLMCDSY